jgi:arginine utilization protein RocB
MAQPENQPDAGDLARRTAEWTIALVGRGSVNGTADEAVFAGWLRDRIAALPIFAGRDDLVWTIPVAADPLGRACVAALVRGGGPRTIILTGHFDTVHTDDYGDLAPLATRPHELKPALLEKLARPDANAVELRARDDLASGDFLPGRGLLDMKSGLAAGLAVLEAFAAAPDRVGNLLFLAVPDEEANSAGARAAAQALPDAAARFGLRLEAAINLDSLVDDGDGRVGRSVALGTIGKLLPSALVVGQAVHASNSLQGFNAGGLAATLVETVEWSPWFLEDHGAERLPAPTLLGMKDNRTAYDVTTPERVWLYWNIMLHRRSPDEVLNMIADHARSGAQQAAGRLTERARLYGETRVIRPAEVLTFAELRSEVLDGNPAKAERFAAAGEELARRGLDLPEQCRLLTDHLWTASGRAGPAVVIGFASLPYLPTQLAGPQGEQLERAVREAAEACARRRGTSIGVIGYFPGISDMSHLGQADPGAIPTIAANTPVWNHAIRWPDQPQPGIPIVNAGPWGRDYHTPLERLHTGYAFEVLPGLLLDIVRRVLNGR